MLPSAKKSTDILTVIRNLSTAKKSKDILQCRTIPFPPSIALDWNDNVSTPEKPNLHSAYTVATDADWNSESKCPASPEVQCCPQTPIPFNSPRSLSLLCNLVSGQGLHEDLPDGTLEKLACKSNNQSLLEISINRCDSNFPSATRQSIVEPANNSTVDDKLNDISNQMFVNTQNSLSDNTQWASCPEHNSPDLDTTGDEAFEALVDKLRPQAREASIPLSSESSFIVSSSETTSDGENTEIFYHQLHNSLHRREENRSRVHRRVPSPRWSSSDSHGGAERNETVFPRVVDRLKISDRPRSRRTERNHTKNNSTGRRTVMESQHTNNGLKHEENLSNEQRHDEFIYSLYPPEDDVAVFHRETRLPRHPSAERYVRRFKANRADLTTRLFNLFNKSIFSGSLPESLEIVWNHRLRKTAGLCKYLRQRVIPVHGQVTMQRSARIELSVKVCTTAERLRDTLLHEACHAAVWIIDGVREQHGRSWLLWANRAKTAWPRLPMVSRCHTYKIDTKFTYRCLTCGAEVNRHSKSLDVTRQVCGRCHGVFQLFRNRPQATNRASTKAPTDRLSLVNSQVPEVENGTPRTPAFAEFVRNNYRSVREKRQHHVSTGQTATGKSAHGEVMEELANLFKQVKLTATPVYQGGGDLGR